MAKMNRERAVKEKRARKQEKKEERKAAAAAANGEVGENPFPEDPADGETPRPTGPQDSL